MKSELGFEWTPNNWILEDFKCFGDLFRDFHIANTMSFATESDEGEILNIAASEDMKNGDLIVCEIIIIIIIKKCGTFYKPERTQCQLANDNFSWLNLCLCILQNSSKHFFSQIFADFLSIFSFTNDLLRNNSKTEIETFQN